MRKFKATEVLHFCEFRKEDERLKRERLTEVAKEEEKKNSSNWRRPTNKQCNAQVSNIRPVDPKRPAKGSKPAK